MSDERVGGVDQVEVMFVGGLPSHVGEVTFRRCMQVEVLDAAAAMNAARGGCVILDSADPAALAFTDLDKDLYASFGSHANAPAAFREKLKAARERAAEYADEMETQFQGTLKEQIVPERGV